MCEVKFEVYVSKRYALCCDYSFASVSDAQRSFAMLTLTVWGPRSVGMRGAGGCREREWKTDLKEKHCIKKR
jgi:hypothetical protein